MDAWQCHTSDRCHCRAPKWKGGRSNLGFHAFWARPLLGRDRPALARRQKSWGLGCDNPGCEELLWGVTMGGRRPSWHVGRDMGNRMQVGVRWADEEGWFCAERVILENRSSVSFWAGLLAPWGGLPLSGSPQNMVLISAVCQWRFKGSNSLNS